MSGKKPITTESFIRELPFSTIRGLCEILDYDEAWKKLVIQIPRRLDGEDMEPRYSHLQVCVFSQRGLKPNGSATSSLIEDWGTQNARLRHLLKVLQDASLDSSVTYLTETLLKKEQKKPPENGYNDKKESDSEQNDPNLQLIYEREKKIQLIYEREKKLPNANKLFSSQNKPKSESVQCLNPISFDSVGDIYGASVGNCPSERVPEENEDKEFDPTPDVLSLKEAPYHLLSTITNNFDDQPVAQGGRLIGCGGFAQVFLGQYSNGYKVAVKRLIINDDLNMEKQFLTELKTLSTYRHKNIVSIFGYSRENKCLVYDFMENGSLEDRLMCKDGTDPLKSLVRMKIAEGTAQGINYLHSVHLIHRDVKSANVLLDVDFTPKVGDFATVRAGPRGKNTKAQSTSVVIGTSAYLAPEAIRFDVSSKLDSFAFGVVLLELLTGLSPMDDSREEDTDLVTYIQSKCEEVDIISLIDLKAGPWSKEHVNIIYDMAVQCLETKKKSRALIVDILPIFKKLDLCSE